MIVGHCRWPTFNRKQLPLLSGEFRPSYMDLRGEPELSDPPDDGNYPVQGMMLRGPPNLDLAKVNKIVNELLATVTILFKFFSTDETRDVIRFYSGFELLII